MGFRTPLFFLRAILCGVSTLEPFLSDSYGAGLAVHRLHTKHLKCLGLSLRLHKHRGQTKSRPLALSPTLKMKLHGRKSLRGWFVSGTVWENAHVGDAPEQFNRDVLKPFRSHSGLLGSNVWLCAWGFAQVLKGFPSERRIHESTLVGETKLLS